MRITLRLALLGASLVSVPACAGSSPEPDIEAPEPPRPAPRLSSGIEPKPVATTPAVVAEAPDFVETPAEEPAQPPTQTATEEPATDEGGMPEPIALGWVAGQPVFAEELLLEWNHFAPREIWLVLDKLIATRLAFAEAQRLAIRLDPRIVEERVRRERGMLEESLRNEGQTGSLDEMIGTVFAQRPDYYLARLREGTIRQMLAERAVRAWTLSESSVRLRLIVVPEGELVGKIQSELAAGIPFDELARQHSVDDTSPNGGLVPFLVRQEQSPLARLAFRTGVGEVGGPVSVGSHEVFVFVEEERLPLQGDWSVIGETVEATLAEDAVRDSEFLVWKLKMERRYPVDLTDAELLLGAPEAGGN